MRRLRVLVALNITLLVAAEPRSHLIGQRSAAAEPPHLIGQQRAAAEPRFHLIGLRRANGRARPYRINRRNTPVTDAILATNIAVYAVLRAPTSWSPRLFSLLAKSDAAIRRGAVHRFVTPVLLHGSLGHLLVNSLSLRNIGHMVEPYLGQERFIAVYVLSGIAGNSLSFYVGRSPLSVGASGAIFGLLGCWGTFLSVNSEFWARRGVHVGDSLSSLAGTFVINAALGLQPGSRIDNMGHLGGLFGGAAASFLIGPRLSQRRLPGGGTIIVDKPLVQMPRPDASQRARKRPKGLS